MRIVAGRHRGRRLQTPFGRTAEPSLRPTGDRLRETIFNILIHSGWGPDGGDPVVDAVVLDAFCGTGALGLEALSRGAASACFLDLSPSSLTLAQRNAELLGEGERIAVRRGDATRPPPTGLRATLAFLDPPYGLGLGPPAITALAAAGWLGDGAVVILETAARDPLPADLDDHRLTTRIVADAAIHFLRIGWCGDLPDHSTTYR